MECLERVQGPVLVGAQLFGELDARRPESVLVVFREQVFLAVRGRTAAGDRPEQQQQRQQRGRAERHFFASFAGPFFLNYFFFRFKNDRPSWRSRNANETYTHVRAGFRRERRRLQRRGRRDASETGPRTTNVAGTLRTARRRSPVDATVTTCDRTENGRPAARSVPYQGNRSIGNRG